MSLHGARQFGIFLLTLIFGLLLQTIAVPSAMAFVWPQWLLLLLAAWALHAPRQPTLFMALLLGLALDVHLNCAMGQHAAGLLVTTYLVARTRAALLLYRRWQISLVVVPLWAGYFLFMSIIDRATGHTANSALRWWPLLSTIAVWPAVDTLIAKLHYRSTREAA